MNPKPIIINIMIIVLFGFFTSGFNINDNTDSNQKDIIKDTKFKTIELVKNLNNVIEGDSEDDGFITNLLKKGSQLTITVVAIPFIITEFVLFLVGIIFSGLSALPPIVNIILFTPLGLFILFGYIIPTIRGN